MDLSVIIITYKERELLKKCLESVFASKTNFSYEVIVTDSNSQDGTIEMLHQDFAHHLPESAQVPLRVMDNGVNLGFSKGNNVAIKKASGWLILLLNADTTIDPNALENSIQYIDKHPEVGAVGCKIMLLNGLIDPSARRKFPNPVNSFLRLFGLKKFSNYNIDTPIDQETEVDAIMGAFFLTRREVIDKVGLLDEEFFMYGEDLDWCWRIKEAGFKIMYYPGAEILHHKYGASKHQPQRTISWAHDAMKIFYRKHYAAEHGWFFNQLIYLGVDIRKILVMIKNFGRGNKSIH